MGMSPQRPGQVLVELGIQPIFPGQYLKDRVLPARGLDVHGAAEAIGISLTVFKALLSQQRRIDVEIAEKLSQFTGTSATFWLNMQEAADLAAETALAPPNDTTKRRPNR